MVVPSDSARRRFGNDLRQRREQAGMSQKEMASAALLSQTMISGLERGEKSTRTEHIARIDEVLNTDGALAQHWGTLLNYAGVPDWFSDIVLLEQEATGIKMFHMSVFPGLFQSEDYARAVVRAGRPWYPLNEVEILVTSRIKRQELLASERCPRLWAVVDEAVIRRSVGGHAVMRTQLDHILELLDSQTMQLQVIPDDGRLQPGLDGAFRIMNFKDRPAAAYAEHVIGGEPIHDADKVEECHMLFGALQAEALPLTASAELIRKVRGELYA